MQKVRVTFNAGLDNGRSFDAQILVNEPSNDLAGVTSSMRLQNRLKIHYGTLYKRGVLVCRFNMSQLVQF